MVRGNKTSNGKNILEQQYTIQIASPAGVPWRSPLVSFLYAYETVICRLQRY